MVMAMVMMMTIMIVMMVMLAMATRVTVKGMLIAHMMPVTLTVNLMMSRIAMRIYRGTNHDEEIIQIEKTASLACNKR